MKFVKIIVRWWKRHTKSVTWEEVRAEILKLYTEK